MPVDPKLLELLVCPACHGAIRELGSERGLECAVCGRLYPIRDGIPSMFVAEAPPSRGGAV